MAYKCENCGNVKKFYSEVSVMGKIMVNPKTGEIKGMVRDIDKKHIDNLYEYVYCYECNELVENDE